MDELLNTHMGKFKEWLGSDVEGGSFGLPGSHLNPGSNGLKSKYQTSDAAPVEEPAPNADRVFGFRSPKDKAQTKERPASTIDSKQRKSLIRVPRLDIT